MMHSQIIRVGAIVLMGGALVGCGSFDPAETASDARRHLKLASDALERKFEAERRFHRKLLEASIDDLADERKTRFEVESGERSSDFVGTNKNKTVSDIERALSKNGAAFMKAWETYESTLVGLLHSSRKSAKRAQAKLRLDKQKIAALDKRLAALSADMSTLDSLEFMVKFGAEVKKELDRLKHDAAQTEDAAKASEAKE